MSKNFYSNGKLLLTGEYAILDGASGLAVPTTYGQSLTAYEIDSRRLVWKSRNEKDEVWFETAFDLEELLIKTEKLPENSEARILLNILREAKKQNPEFLKGKKGCRVETKLTFPRKWGLGSSSTLINNIAQWAEIDPFTLLRNSFSGSGYDIACAQHDYPITYRLKNGDPIVTKVGFDPPFKDRLYFIHLNKKQNSREGIAQYRNMDFDSGQLMVRISELTKEVVSCEKLSVFESLLRKHEALLSRTLKMPTVKESLFPNYGGAIKSLGAWGGDFILATGGKETPTFFREKGYTTIVPYGKMVL